MIILYNYDHKTKIIIVIGKCIGFYNKKNCIYSFYKILYLYRLGVILLLHNLINK